LTNDEIDEMRNTVKQLYQDYQMRCLALNLSLNLSKPCIIDGVEIEVNSDNKIVPLRFYPDALTNGDTLIMPLWLDITSENYFVYRYSDFDLAGIEIDERNVYNTIYNFEKLIFVSNYIQLKQFAFLKCKFLKYVDVSIFNKLVIGMFKNCYSLEVADIRNIEVLDKEVFENCKNLKKVIISSKLKRVRERAFKCVGIGLELEVVDYINEGLRVRRDGNYAFYKALEKYKKV